MYQIYARVECCFFLWFFILFGDIRWYLYLILCGFYLLLFCVSNHTYTVSNFMTKATILWYFSLIFFLFLHFSVAFFYHIHKPCKCHRYAMNSILIWYFVRYNVRWLFHINLTEWLSCVHWKCVVKASNTYNTYLDNRWIVTSFS